MRIGIREAIFFIVLLAVPAVSLFYVFKPRNEEIRQALDEIQVKQTRLDDLNAMTSKIPDLELELQRGEELIDQIERKLPSERDVEGILKEVWLIAKRNQLTVKGVKSEKPVPAANYMELPLRMIMMGEFDGFYQFTLELENLPRITRMHHLSLERLDSRLNRDADTSAGTTRAEFTLSIYFESTDDAGE